MTGKSPEELDTVEGRDFLFTPFPVVFVFEGYRLVIDLNQAMIGDGYFMRVPAQVLHHRFGTSKGTPGIDNPFVFERLFCYLLWYIHLFSQFGHKPGTEYRTDRPFWKKVSVFVPGHLPLACRCYPSSGNNAMNMWMQPELLSPGVEYGYHASFGTHVLGISCKRLNGGP